MRLATAEVPAGRAGWSRALLASASTVGLLAGTPALAQDAEEAETEDEDVIVVTGIRGSITDAINTKRMDIKTFLIVLFLNPKCRFRIIPHRYPAPGSRCQLHSTAGRSCCSCVRAAAIAQHHRRWR